MLCHFDEFDKNDFSIYVTAFDTVLIFYLWLIFALCIINPIIIMILFDYV